MRIASGTAALVAPCLLAVAAAAQQSIDPFWIYTSGFSWHRTAAPDHFETSPFNLALLSPEGEYAEFRVSLLRTGKHGVPHLDLPTLTATRVGHWTRTDDNAVRFTSHAVVHVMGGTSTKESAQPVLYENAILRGKAPNRLTAAIVSPRQVLVPLSDLSDPKDLRTAIDQAISPP